MYCEKDTIKRLQRLQEKLADKNMIFKFNGDKYAVFSMDQYERTQYTDYTLSLEDVEDFAEKRKRYDSNGEYHFIKQPKDMYSREKENSIMGFIDVKEKVIKTLDGFLDRNKRYAVELYISNAITKSGIGRIFITLDRTYNTDDEKFILKWNKDETYDVRYNDFSIPYDEVLTCYEETEEEDKLKIAETAVVILKNGMEFNFQCVGIKI